MDPPEFLIPLQLLGRRSLSVHKIEDSAILLVPTVLNHFNCCLYRLLDELWTVESLAQIHDEPHRFDGMSRIDQSSVEGVGERTVLIDILHDDSTQFGT